MHYGNLNGFRLFSFFLKKKFSHCKMGGRKTFEMILKIFFVSKLEGVEK